MDNEANNRVLVPLFKTDLNIDTGLSINLQLKYSQSKCSKVELFLILDYMDGQELPFFEEISTVGDVWTEVSRMIIIPEAKTVKLIGLSVSNISCKPDGILTVGRLRASLSPDSKIILKETIHISTTEKVFDEASDRYVFLISWMPTNARFYELFVNDAWIGTSFSEKYRVSLPSEEICKCCNVRILVYGHDGEMMADLDGLIEY